MDYKALDTDWNEIRLLTLLPRETNGYVRCRLDHVSLINASAYVALSYRWGKPPPTKKIIINDTEVLVQVNLESALRYLQTRGHNRLWVDAICINQADNAERSQQLLWMGSIYRRATLVAAWVGEEADDSDNAIEFIKKVSIHQSELRNIEHNLTLFGALRTFLEREYWRRVWVIQELAFARQTIIYCGQQALHWETLHSALEVCASASHSECINSLVSSPGFQNARGLAKFHEDASKNKPIHFLDALHRSVNSLASEPRDKIFALLGLTYDSDIIPLLGCGSTTTTLPSWAPNWFRLDDSTLARRIAYLHRVDKYKSHQIAEIPEIPKDRIRIKGVFIDKVDGLCLTPSETSNSVAIKMQSTSTANPYGTKFEVFQAIARTLTRKSTWYSKLNGNFRVAIRKMWSRDLAANYLEMGTAVDRLMPRIDSWLAATGSFSINNKALAEWCYEAGIGAHWGKRLGAMLRGVEERLRQKENYERVVCDIENVLGDNLRLMTTSQGFLGWAHPRAEHGDRIFILRGCSMPVILRPKSDNGYTLVGDAFLENLMSVPKTFLEEFLDKADIQSLAGSRRLSTSEGLLSPLESSPVEFVSEKSLRSLWCNHKIRPYMQPQTLELDINHIKEEDWKFLEIF